MKLDEKSTIQKKEEKISTRDEEIMIGENRLFFGLESLVIQIVGSSKSIRCEVHSWS